ncbi:MAG: tetratricopeptide repeat protein [Candidatus Zixiibacteriota bacterium]
MSPKKIRISKHMMKEDKLVTIAFRLSEWVQKNTQKILTLAGVVVAIGVIAFIIFSTRARRSESAYQLLGNATVAFRVGNLNQAISDMETITSKYGGTKAAPQASFLLGNLLFFTGQFDQAISAFEEFRKKYKQDPFLLVSSTSGIAQCYLEKKEFGRAGDFFIQAFESDPQGVLAKKCLLSAGFSYGWAKDFEKAKSAYQKVLELFPEAPEATKAKMELAEINFRYAEK